MENIFTNEEHLRNCIDTLKKCVVYVDSKPALDGNKVDKLQFLVAISKVVQCIESGVITKEDFLRRVLPC